MSLVQALPPGLQFLFKNILFIIYIFLAAGSLSLLHSGFLLAAMERCRGGSLVVVRGPLLRWLLLLWSSALELIGSVCGTQA